MACILGPIILLAEFYLLAIFGWRGWLFLFSTNNLNNYFLELIFFNLLCSDAHSFKFGLISHGHQLLIWIKRVFILNRYRLLFGDPVYLSDLIYNVLVALGFNNFRVVIENDLQLHIIFILFNYNDSCQYHFTSGVLGFWGLGSVEL